MTKAAILIDGGYFLKRLPAVRPDIDTHAPADVAKSIRQQLGSHPNQLNRVYGVWDHTRNDGSEESQENRSQYISNPFRFLYRCFYYDAPPYEGKAHTPIAKHPIDYSKTNQAIFRRDLFGILRR